MATQAEYAAGAAALAKLLNTDIAAEVPSFFQGAIAAKVPELSSSGAKAVIDALDAYRAQQPPTPAKEPTS
jgi:hypothetical protein